jgi:hypothetical protein
MSNMRSCLVSFTDTEGIEHTVRVPAETLLRPQWKLWPHSEVVALLM